MLRVKDLLKAKGMTAKELAQSMGISEASLSLTIKPGANPSLQTLQRIATALDVPITDLFAPVASRDTSAGRMTCPHCGKPIAVHISEA